MKAIILSAGQGRRLGDLTRTAPKCLLPLGGRSLLDWQLAALAAAGMEEAVIVTGFGAEQVEAELGLCSHPGLTARTHYNPDFATSDNLMSCWSVRAEMESEFAIINGDTLFDPRIVVALREDSDSPISLAIRAKPAYDADDMKVACVGNRIHEVSKALQSPQVGGEAIGLSWYRGNGAHLMRDTLIAFAERENAARQWYLSAVSHLASQGHVGAAFINDLASSEVDCPADIAPTEIMLRDHLQAFLADPVQGAPGSKRAIA